MNIEIEPPVMSGTRCYRDDLPRIQRLSHIMASKERAAFNAEHVVSRGLDLLEKFYELPPIEGRVAN